MNCQFRMLISILIYADGEMALFSLNILIVNKETFVN